MLEELPGLAFGAVLVAARVGGAVMLLPGLGEPEVPPTVRLCLLLTLVALLMPPLSPDLPALPEAVPELARLLATEVGDRRVPGFPRAGRGARAGAGRTGRGADDRPVEPLADGCGVRRPGDGDGAPVRPARRGAGVQQRALRPAARRSGGELCGVAAGRGLAARQGRGSGGRRGGGERRSRPAAGGAAGARRDAGAGRARARGALGAEPASLRGRGRRTDPGGALAPGPGSAGAASGLGGFGAGQPSCTSWSPAEPWRAAAGEKARTPRTARKPRHRSASSALGARGRFRSRATRSGWRRCSAPRSSARWPFPPWAPSGCARSASPCPPERRRPTRSARRASRCSGPGS